MRNNDSRLREQIDRLGRPAIGTLNREIARHERKESYRRVALGVLACLIVTMAAIIIITNLWVAVLQVDGSSMNPLLQMDEVVLAVRTDSPKKNDVIAFTHNDKIYIKRVIALGGDRVDMSKDGTVSVNGETLKEPYVTSLSRGSCDIELPFQVPPGSVFVLGDNRPQSLDSRDSRIGTVSGEQIVGKVKFRMWPVLQTGSIS